MSTPVSRVLSKLHRCFPDKTLAGTAAAILETYGGAPSEIGGDRVLLAVLKLSRGDIERLQYYLDAAKSDWRNVVTMAAYPEMLRVGAQIRSLDGDAKRAIHERDLAITSGGCGAGGVEELPEPRGRALGSPISVNPRGGALRGRA